MAVIDVDRAQAILDDMAVSLQGVVTEALEKQATEFREALEKQETEFREALEKQATELSQRTRHDGEESKGQDQVQKEVEKLEPKILSMKEGTPSFSTAEAFKYMGHFTPMWVSNTNDSTTVATMTFIRLEKSSTDGRLWIGTNKPWLAFDEIIMPQIVKRVVHPTNPAKSEEERAPGYGEAPTATYSVMITRRAGDKEEEGQGRWYLTSLDEDAIRGTSEGWLWKVMVYIWAKATEERGIAS